MQQLVARGDVEPSELATAAVRAIVELDPALNAVTTLFEPWSEARVMPFLLKDAGAALAGMPVYAGRGLLCTLSTTSS
jgi:Asp-tRNA(Asn)/Glu-tRNA(Gln) amidotransferase A subunit family amidase